MLERNWDDEFLDIINFNRVWSGDYDPIDQAALDTRAVDAAQFALAGAETALVRDPEDFIEVLAQVRHDYCLEPEQVDQAIDIAQERLVDEPHE